MSQAPWLERQALQQCLVALAPGMVLAGLTGHPLLLPLNLVTVSLLLGISPCQRSLAQLLAHAALVALGDHTRGWGALIKSMLFAGELDLVLFLQRSRMADSASFRPR